MLRGYIVAAPRPNRVPKPGTLELCQIRAWLSIATIPNPRMTFCWMWFHSSSRVAPPTGQYERPLGFPLACLTRSPCACAGGGAGLAPTPARPPSAVRVKALPDVLRKSRRDRSMAFPYGNGQVRLRIDPSDGLVE